MFSLFNRSIILFNWIRWCVLSVSIKPSWRKKKCCNNFTSIIGSISSLKEILIKWAQCLYYIKSVGLVWRKQALRVHINLHQSYNKLVLWGIFFFKYFFVQIFNRALKWDGPTIKIIAINWQKIQHICNFFR